MRVLLISYYFPPCGGAPVQRWLKWLPELVANGIEVTVLTTREGDYPVRDESLLAKIPPQVRVERCPAPRLEKLWKLATRGGSALPYGDLSKARHRGPLKRLLIWLRLNLIVPDLRVFWNPAAYRAAVEILKSQQVDLIITTGPPHSTQLLGLRLKRRFRLKWVADWRDPWSTIYYLQLNPPTRFAMNWQRSLERKVAAGADLNVVVSEYLSRQLQDGKKAVIYNGYDASQTPPAMAEGRAPTRGEKFRLKYVGNLTEGQDLATLVKLIAEQLTKDDIALELVGTKLSPAQSEMLRSMLPGKHTVKGFVAHEAALGEMADSEVLLLLINDYPGFEGMLTTKLFEYLAVGAPILCFGPHGGEAERLIGAYGAGACFSHAETEQAGTFLKSLYAQWQSGATLRHNRDISALSAQSQALRLIDLLREIEKD